MTSIQDFDELDDLITDAVDQGVQEAKWGVTRWYVIERDSKFYRFHITYHRDDGVINQFPIPVYEVERIPVTSYKYKKV